MLVSLKALERSFTGEIRRMFYLLQSMKVPRPSERGQWCMRDTVKSMRALAQAECKAGTRAGVSEKK